MFSHFTIAEYIKDEETDTDILVVSDGTIILAFKWITVRRNLKTNFNLLYSPAKSPLLTRLGPEDEAVNATAEENSKIWCTRIWRCSKIVDSLLDRRTTVTCSCRAISRWEIRPRFLPNHLLRVALGTNCNLDLFMGLELNWSDIFASSLGAPPISDH